MMNLVRCGSLLMLGMFASQVSAAPVDGGKVTTFQSGTTLSSTQMNTTIGALVSAINDNATRLALVEAKVAASESKVATIEAQANAPLDLVERHFCVSQIDAGFIMPVPLSQSQIVVNTTGQTVGTFSRINGVGGTMASSKASAVFHQGGTVTVNDFYDVGKQGSPGSPVFSNDPNLGEVEATWTLEGNLLTVAFPGEDADIAKLIVMKSGEVMVGSNARSENVGNGIKFETSLIILIEVSDVSTCETSL